jgi:hypothetical protein
MHIELDICIFYQVTSATYHCDTVIFDDIYISHLKNIGQKKKSSINTISDKKCTGNVR